MAAASCCSLVSLYTFYLRHIFHSSGLKPALTPIDGDTTLHCWVPHRGHRKPALLLIHGFGPSAVFQWHRQVRSLALHFDLYVPDLLFFGESTTKSSQRSDVFQAACIAKLLDAFGVGRFAVVGTSYGGFVAYHLARMCGERVERVVIASSGINKRRREEAELAARANVGSLEEVLLPTTAAQLRTLVRLALFRPPRFAPVFVLEDILTTLILQNREEKLELLRDTTLGKDDDVRISPLKQEILIVWGEHDEIFPLQKAYELTRLLGENVRLEVMRKTSHLPQIEHPRRFNEVVENFLGVDVTCKRK